MIKRITLFLLVVLATITASYGQASGYSFTETTETYTAVAGTDATATGDDGSQNAIAIGFPFRFDNVDYTHFSINTNGWIKLGTSTVAIGISPWTNALGNTVPHQPLLAALWDDNHRSTGSIQYAVTGTSPNQILEIGWDQVNIGGSGATSATALASFKIRIRETSNIIEYIYGPTLDLAGTLTASVGINGTASFLSVTPGTTATTSNATANNTIASTVGLVGKKYIFTPPTCFAPSAVTASAVTTTTATVSWTAPTTAPALGYEYFLSTTNTAPTATATPTGTTAAGVTTVNLTSLASSTAYFIWVRGVCSTNDKSSWTAVRSFTTQCLPVTTLPWTENFDALATGTNIFPTCWTYLNTLENWYITTTPVANSGANSLRRIWSTDGWAFTPLTTLTAGVSYTFSYFVRTDNDTVGFDITVAAGTSQTSAAMTTINAVTGYQGAAWIKKSHIFIPTATGNYSFGLKVTAPFDPDGINFDDFRLELSPNCLEPTALVSSAITSNGGTVSFTAPANAPSDGYQYFVSTTNVAPLTTATPTGSVPAGSTSVTIAALTPNTLYYVWVRSNCGSGFTSIWSQSISFRTACLPTALPWTENFDALATGTNIFPPCWSFANTTSTWAISTTPVANSGANSLRRTWSTDGWAFTPLATLTAGVSYTFSYFVRTNDAIIGYDITVAAGTSQTVAAMTTINSVTGYQGASWTKVTHIFIPTTTGNYSFGLKVTAPVDPNGINFDDFKLNLTPTCIEPTVLTASAITSNIATVSWTAPTAAPANGYQYYVSTTNTAPLVTTPATGTVGAGTTNVNLTGLNPNTLYYIWVRSVCGTTDSSAWSQSTSFRTACLATTVPWTENFDTLATGTDILPACWRFANTLSNWSISSTQGANSAPNVLRRTWSTDGWAFTQLATLTAGTSYTFSYFVKTNTATPGYDITIAAGNAQTSADMTTTLSTVTAYQGTTWVKQSHVFIPTTSGDYSIGIRVVAPVNPSGINFDDFKLDLTPTCIEPTALTVTYLASTNADVTWTASVTAPAEGYEVFYSTTATTPADTAVALTGTPAGVTTANLSGLTSNTLYYVWVRSACSGTNKSAWSSRGTFTTPCTAFVPTYTQNFATFPATCWSRAAVGTVATGPTGTANGIWAVDGFLNVGTTGAIKVNLFGAPKIGWMISPLIDMSIGNYRAKFKYGLTDWGNGGADTMGSDDSVQFVASQDGGTTWTTLATFDASSNVSNTTNNFEVNLPTYTSTTTKFAFLASTGAVSDTQDYDFFIDDFIVETISCDSPTAVTNSNIASTTATIGWTSPTTAPALGYEYYYSTTNTAPLSATVASGTTAAGVTTANLTGLTAVTTYYVWVRSLCSSSSKSPWTAVVNTFTTLATPCVSPTVTFAKQSNCPTATFSITVDVTNMGSSTSLTITDNQSSPAQTATATGIRTFGPYANATNVIITVSGGATCNVISASMTQDVCPPANDLCTAPLPLTIGTAFATSPISGSILNATTSTFLNLSCAPDISSDVWFSVVVPSTGNVTIETQAAATNSMTDTVLAAFSGSCGALTQVGCSDNNGASSMSLISLTGQAPGSTLLIGVWKFGTAAPTATTTNFTIAAYDVTLSTNNFDNKNFYAYPNPVKDLLNLSYNKELTSVAIYNVLGQEVASKNMNDTQTEIDMSNLAAGTYLVKVTADNQVKTIRVIKE